MNTTSRVLLSLAVLGATSLFAADGAALYKKCAGCHGQKAEKKALGKSAVVAGWDVEKSVAALQGYKDGTYGGAMKGVMKGQVASYSPEDIKAVSEFMATLK